MSKVWLIVLAIAVGVVLGIQVFTAEGAPSAPLVQSSTSLNGQVQTFSFTFTATVLGSQPINSIDEQGAKVLFNIYQNGHPIAVGQSVALGVISQSGFQYTLQGQASWGLPSVCPSTGCGAVVENVSVNAKTVLPAWTGVYSSKWVNVTFSNFANYNTPQSTAPATPAGTFLLNFLGAALLLAAIELTIAIAWWPWIWTDLAAGLSWLSFGAVFVLSLVVP